MKYRIFCRVRCLAPLGILVVVLLVLTSCKDISSSTPATALAPPSSSTTTSTFTQTPLSYPTGTSVTPLSTLTTPVTIPPTPTVKVTMTPAQTAPATVTPSATAAAIPIITPPSALIKSRGQLNSTEYAVFAWNDLGMHCANPTYDKAVLLPPYNTIWAQVVKRGNPPQVVSKGLNAEYKIINNTYSYGKGSFGQFWDNAKKLFGSVLAKNTGLNLSDPNTHNGLSGAMAVKNDHFEAIGIPLTPINDDGTWNPYQVGQITIRDSSGKVLAETDVTMPISDEINCGKCHGSDPFQDILSKHDRRNGTSLLSQEPVLCASCHGDPALGVPDAGPRHYLSERIHGFHAGITPQPACYDCHPGKVTSCSRSLAHTAADGNCTTCHGNLAQVSASIVSGRIPWVNEPKCVTCHTGAANIDTGSVLYRNATGHGGVFCASCHSSPHAMVPTSILFDNYQALQYEGAAKSIGSCGACHRTSRGGGEMSGFIETHGGANPRVPNACNICHTSVPADTGQWPHSFQWKATQGTGSAREN